MKKQYMQPELEAIDIKVNTILCASTIGFSDTEFDNGDALAPENNFDFGDDNAFTFEKDSFDFGE